MDKFYTNRQIAKSLYEWLKTQYNLKDYLIVEPSAGDGSFVELFKKDALDFVAFDILPEGDDIIKADFLHVHVSDYNPNNKKVFVIGNPPFGKNASLALKFVNKSSIDADFIAFILPATFKKQSIIHRLSPSLSLIHIEDIEKNAFVSDGKTFHVNSVFCVFQRTVCDSVKDKSLNISVQSVNETVQENVTECKVFDFCSKEEADFAIRRVGGHAGKLIEVFDNYSPSSHYYIKSLIPKEELKALLVGLYNELHTTASRTVSNPSLSKSEFVEIVSRAKNS